MRKLIWELSGIMKGGRDPCRLSYACALLMSHMRDDHSELSGSKITAYLMKNIWSPRDLIQVVKGFDSEFANHHDDEAEDFGPKPPSG